MKILVNRIEAKPIPPCGYYSAAAAIAVLLWMAVRCFGMHQIGGGDHGVLVDVAWRTRCGQTPYMDFPCPWPVLWVLAAKLSFHVSGVCWSSMVAAEAVFAVTTFAWSLALLTALMGRTRLPLLLAATVQAATSVFVSFLWYNPAAAVLCIIYALSAMLWLRRPLSFAANLSYSASLALLMGLKLNTAAPLVVLVSAYLLAVSPFRAVLLAVSMASYAAFTWTLACAGVSQWLMAESLAAVAHRAYRFSHFLQIANPVEKASVLVPACLVVLPAALLMWRNRSGKLAVPASLLLVGAYGFVSNCDQWVDLSTGIAALVLAAWEVRSAAWLRYASWLCAVVAVASLAQGAYRERVRGVGYMMFFENDGDKHVVRGGFFDGVHCGDVFAEVLREESSVVHKAEAKSVWFGPCMEWGYAAFGVRSPSGQPVQWRPGEAFKKSDAGYYLGRFMDSRFETLVFFKDTTIGYSQDEVSLIASQYDIDDSFHTITVAHLRH